MKFFEPQQIGNKVVSPFTVGSGILTTNLTSIKKAFDAYDHLGIITTKSIGPVPRLVPDYKNEGAKNVEWANREPIIHHLGNGTFINAVGLSNPGADKFAEELSDLVIPDNKFLLVSVFGKDAKEITEIAEKLTPYADGIEINLSCPHAKKRGMALGQDPDLVYKIIKEVSKITDKPIFAKLTPNTKIIGEIAEKAVKAGAYGVTEINTFGPQASEILSNKVGGISGNNITKIGIDRVNQTRKALPNIPIIGMGGISTANHVKAYHKAGANFFGIGSALARMTEKEINSYFHAIINDLEKGTDYSRLLPKKIDTSYKPHVIESIKDHQGYKIFTMDSSIEATPGQYVFAHIPGVGEKPFSVMDNSPFRLGILEVGKFTRAFNSLKVGDSFDVRGPYGQGVQVPKNSKVTLVGGGSGIAGIYLLAKELSKKNNVTIMLGAKDKAHLGNYKEFEQFGNVKIATEDGSLGVKGYISQLFNKVYMQDNYIFNCGPKPMADAVYELEKQTTSLEKIFFSIDYMTSCGIGICGRCVDPKGIRSCVEGPFLNK